MKAIPYLLLLTIGVCAPPVYAQEFVWAADSEGGAPYVFPDLRRPDRIVGFEVDIANALASRLGLTPRFVQNQWDGLVPGLERNEYGFVINGLEITPERAEVINFSTPYYYSTLTLTVRLDEGRIQRADDLSGHIVGTLKASFAEQYLGRLGGVTIRSYEGQVNPYMDLALGRLDAVVMDTPIALYYAIGSQVRNVELSGVRLAFGIGVRKADTERLAQVNAAIEAMKQDGSLKTIYQDWGIYNIATAQYFGDRDPVTNDRAPRYREYLDAMRTERTFGDQLEQYWTFLPLLLRGALVTLEISLASMSIAI
ncbi:MAG: amino acid ABC transporter substrate-binding protein, partial [Acidobacteria bacterium]|nr:amino acid ABC transporter substrate-binding protein [Acidobacteriota bacterium]